MSNDSIDGNSNFYNNCFLCGFIVMGKSFFNDILSKLILDILK